jgi:hypothetical protein
MLTLCAVVFTGFAANSGAAQTSRNSVSASEVNGTFRMNFTGKFNGSSNEVKILALGGGRLRIMMDLLYPYLVGKTRELGANMGSVDGEATIKGDTAIYSSTEFGDCRITIKFVRPGTIKISQEGTDVDCGFGHNVVADGTYTKVSSKTPDFDRSDQ